MKNTTKPFFILLLSIAALFFITNTSLSQQTAEQLFEKALYMEEATGDLEQAIADFEWCFELAPNVLNRAELMNIIEQLKSELAP